MGHDWRFAEVGGPSQWWGSWPSLVVLGLIALLFVFLVVTILSRRNEPARSEVEREVYENMDGQIRSMLFQAGGALTQDRIRDNLGIPLDAVSTTLAAMERRGDIQRQWLPLDYTYQVYLRDDRAKPAVADGDPLPERSG